MSGDDYETIAAQTPGVGRARASGGGTPTRSARWSRCSSATTTRRSAAARAALRAFADPNRPVVVALAAPVLRRPDAHARGRPRPRAEAVSAAVSARAARSAGAAVRRRASCGSATWSTTARSTTPASRCRASSRSTAWRFACRGRRGSRRRTATALQLPPGFPRWLARDEAPRGRTPGRRDPRASRAGRGPLLPAARRRLHISTEVGRHGR